MSANSTPNGVGLLKANGHQRQPNDANERAIGDRRTTVDFELSSLISLGADLGAGEPTVAAAKDDPTKSNAERERVANSRIPRWKRHLDLACTCLTFPLWLTTMALVSTWILLASPGPLLYSQERVGYRGRRFMILKFRTMKTNVETKSHEGYFERLMQTDCPMTKLDCNDVRLIRGARILRALGLDELPQIFNVLRGEMSLVGPRPCTPHEFEHYQPAQKERVNAPPGLTGYWQVNGKNKTTFSEMIAMDIFYGKNMSIRMDLNIMLRTVPAIGTQVFESLTRKTGAKIRPMLKNWPIGRLRCREPRVGRRVRSGKRGDNII